MMDFMLSKPSHLRGYPLHRLVSGIANGKRVIFADKGDHLLLRSDAPINAGRIPSREVADGSILAFEMTACTGKKVRGHHRYFDVSDWRSRHEWLGRQGEACGFKVLTVHCFASMSLIKDETRSFHVDCTRFTGVLKVTDLVRFNECLLSGLGKARAFGFGLLVI